MMTRARDVPVATRIPNAPGREGTLVVQTSHLGDTVLSTPLFAMLSGRGPVDVVVRPDAAPLLHGHPAVRDVLVFDKRGRHRGLRGLLRFVDSIRTRENGEARAPQAAYLLQTSLRSALVPLLLGVPVRIGWQSSLVGRLLYSHRVAWARDTHFVAQCLALADARPVPERLSSDAPPPVEHVPQHATPRAVPRPQLASSEQARAEARRLLATAPWASDDLRPLLILAPASRWGTKCWPHYAEFARLYGRAFRVLVVGGAADRETTRPVAKAAPDVLDVVGHAELPVTFALFEMASAAVVNDSVALHLASAANTPVVALFGPTVPAFGFAPLSARHAVVEHDVMPCRPCHRHGPPTCPRGHHRCMQELSPSRVRDALSALLAS